ncbi:hypothetical protein OUZ56_032648 [Daphnia magna]|uniref:Calcineurin-like phosphoesterase domain-containing protein n=1 Tax=Daphnia magna TaxID=35525 RepID=A0ABR0B9W3_9CRUS|nr:hypothetical protein OUZ56_032648 [Daphnia magna]
MQSTDTKAPLTSREVINALPRRFMDATHLAATIEWLTASKKANVIGPISAGSLPIGCEAVASVVFIDAKAETYPQAGKCALLKVALDKLAAAANISWDPEASQRLDDRSDPLVCEFRAVGTLTQLTGSPRIVSATRRRDLNEGSVVIDAIRKKAEKPNRDGRTRSPDEEIFGLRKFIERHAESRARNAATRTLLGMRSSYSEDDLKVPFVIFSTHFTGRISASDAAENPHLQAAMSEAIASHFLGARSALFPRSARPPMTSPKAPGTTRIVFVGDSHFDERDRLDECATIHARIADFVKTNGVDAVVHTGDLFERKSTLAERLAVADWLSKITYVPVVLIRGNHDQPGELTFFSRMFENVHAVEDARVVHLWNKFTRKHLASIACIAWPERAAIFAEAGSHDEGEASLAAALQTVFAGLNQDLVEGRWDETRPRGPVRLAAAHAMVRGATTSVGQPLMGCDMEGGTSDLATLGEWDVGGAEIVYTGSPRRTSFGENEEKGIVAAAFGSDGALLQRFRWSTNATPMLDIELEFKPDAVMILPLIDVAGAEIRFRYTVTPERQDQARAWAKATAAHWTREGAIRVKIEPEVVAAVRARTPEIALATTDAQKLETYWAAKGLVLAEDERTALFHKLATAKTAALRRAAGPPLARNQRQGTGLKNRVPEARRRPLPEPLLLGPPTQRRHRCLAGPPILGLASVVERSPKTMDAGVADQATAPLEVPVTTAFDPSTDAEWRRSQRRQPPQQKRAPASRRGQPGRG